MSDPLAEALGALERYGHAHARVRHAQQAATLHLERVQSEFRSVFAEVVLPHLRGFEEMSERDIAAWWDEREESVLALLSNEGDPAELPDELIEHVDAVAQPFLEDLHQQGRQLDEAERLLDAPHREAVTKVQLWLDEVRTGTAAAEDGWPELVAAWRNAVDLTKLEAARALQVSQSTIVRYENHTRCPSIPVMTELVGRIADMPNPLTGDALRFWESLRTVAAMFEETPAAVVATMGSVAEEEQLRRDIDDALDLVDTEGLRLLRTISSDAGLRNKLIEWAGGFRLDVLGQSIAKAISLATLAPSSSEGGEGS